MIAAASESDNKEADHSLVNCVGLFKADSGKDYYFCKSTCVLIVSTISEIMAVGSIPTRRIM